MRQVGIGCVALYVFLYILYGQVFINIHSWRDFFNVFFSSWCFHNSNSKNVQHMGKCYVGS